MKLLIDFGNTRIKVALLEADAHNMRFLGAYAYDAVLAALSTIDLKTIDTVVYAGMVRNPGYQNIQRDVLKLFPPTQITEIHVSAEAFGVRTLYDATQLGVDRFLGLIASRATHSGNTLVIDAGTYMTADILNADGVHLGGIIMPRLSDLMDVSDLSLDTQIIPKETKHAVAVGRVLALEGMLARMYQWAHELSSIDQCVLTGGDAKMLMPYAKTLMQGLPVILQPYLVLDGLTVIAS